MKHLDVILILVLLGASLASTLTLDTKSTKESQRLREVYRKDQAELLRQVDNCQRYYALSQKSEGTCDGALRGYDTMVSGPVCEAAFEVAREKQLLAPQAKEMLARKK